MGHSGSGEVGTRTRSQTGDSHGIGAGSRATAYGQAPSPELYAKGVTSSLVGTSTQSQMGGGSVLHGRVGAGEATTPKATMSPGQAPSPMPRGEHGSGSGVGSGAGDGRTSSPEQMLKWRHDEMNDERMGLISARGDDSSAPWGSLRLMMAILWVTHGMAIMRPSP